MDDNELNINEDEIKVEENDENAEQLMCDSCSRLFETERKLSIHKKDFHDLVACVDCGEVIPGQKTLFDHRRRKHQTKVCPTCFKQLSAANAARHINTNQSLN